MKLGEQMLLEKPKNYVSRNWMDEIALTADPVPRYIYDEKSVTRIRRHGHKEERVCRPDV